MNGGDAHGAAWKCRDGKRRCRKDEDDAHLKPAIPVMLKLAYAVATVAIARVYKRRYGAGNFLWLSDIAFALTTSAVIAESRRLASIAAGVLPLELAWTLDLLCRGKLLGLADYMFDRTYPISLRALSFFHVALPPTLLWMLRRFGYDRAALAPQIAMIASALILSRVLTEPEKNINWAFGIGPRPRSRLPAPLYLAFETAALTAGMLVPAHLLLRQLFPVRS
jgi:hypothetical protein